MDEVELKFRLTGIEEHVRLRAALRDRGAERVGAEHEENLMFDDDTRRLAAMGTVLRLRVLDGGPRAKLTYKGEARYDGAVKSRREVEVEVTDAETMRHLLESLGYAVSLTYAKERETWRLEATEVVLDTLVFGHFCEIEGPAATITRLAADLGLGDDQVEIAGYASLMARYNDGRQHMNEEGTGSFDPASPPRLGGAGSL